MTLRNIHIKPAPAEPDQTSRLPKLRFVTNDPAREYAARPGEVEKLPDSVAALILCKQEFRTVSARTGITIEGRNYWSENSVTIATKGGTTEKVLCTYNRQQLDVIHILTSDGEYVESIPLDGSAKWFDKGDLKILGAKRRANQRRMDRIAHLHQPDSAAALERETHNEAQLKGLVQTFPTTDRSASQPEAERIDPNSCQIGRRENLSPSGERARPRTPQPAPSPAAFPRASRILDIQRSLGEQRAAFESKRAAISAETGSLEEFLDDHDGPAPQAPSRRVVPNEEGSLADFI